MKLRAKKILGIALLMAVLLISSHVPANQQSQGDKPSDAKQELSVAIPDLADIIPMAIKLSGRLATLKNNIKDGLADAEIEKKYAKIEENLKVFIPQLKRVKDSKDYRFNKLVGFKAKIDQENKFFQDISKPLTQAIRQLGAWRTEWLAEKKHWDEWRSSLMKEGEFDQLESIFFKVNSTIDTALSLILPRLMAMLSMQEKAGNIQTKINVFTVEVNRLIFTGRRGVMIGASPPMFSSRFFLQFGNELWYTAQKGLFSVSLPGSRFFARFGWLVLLQSLFSLIVIIAVYRNRQVLSDSKRWRFLAARPFSAGLFFGTIVAVLFYEYGGNPTTWDLVNTIIGGVSFARLLKGLIEASWKRQFVYWLMFVLIVTGLIDVVNLPLPFYRIYDLVYLDTI